MWEGLSGMQIGRRFRAFITFRSQRLSRCPSGKESTCNAGGDPDPIPVLGRSPGEGNGYLLQYSCLEDCMDRGAWRATVHGVAKSQIGLSNSHFHLRSLQRQEVAWCPKYIAHLTPRKQETLLVSRLLIQSLRVTSVGGEPLGARIKALRNLVQLYPLPFKIDNVLPLL